MFQEGFGKTQAKHCAALGVVFGGNRSAVSGYDSFTKRQADSIPGGLCALSPIESVKQPRQVFFGKAFPAVMDSDFGENGSILADDCDVSIVSCAFHAVFQNILQSL